MYVVSNSACQELGQVKIEAGLVRGGGLTSTSTDSGQSGAENKVASVGAITDSVKWVHVVEPPWFRCNLITGPRDEGYLFDLDTPFAPRFLGVWRPVLRTG